MGYLSCGSAYSTVKSRDMAGMPKYQRSSVVSWTDAVIFSMAQSAVRQQQEHLSEASSFYRFSGLLHRCPNPKPHQIPPVRNRMTTLLLHSIDQCRHVL